VIAMRRQPTPEELQALANTPMTVPTLLPWLGPAPGTCPWCQEVGPLEYQAQDLDGSIINICGPCWDSSEMIGPE
jgi:hypothetical protein